jgi:hypothetical protein
MSTRIYYEGDTALSEYFHYVDLLPRADPASQLPGIRGVICTHINREDVGVFSMGAVECGLLTYFRMQMKGRSVGASSRAWFTFTPKVGVPPFTFRESAAAQTKILQYLSDNKRPIIWKECKHGYEITPSGVINRKWKLNPF